MASDFMISFGAYSAIAEGGEWVAVTAMEDGNSRVVEAALWYPQAQGSLAALKAQLRAPACGLRVASVSRNGAQHVTTFNRKEVKQRSRKEHEESTPVRAFWPL